MIELPSNFPVLKTKRLELKPITEAHIEDLFEMRADPVIMEFINRPLAKSAEDAMALIEILNLGWNNRESITWGLFLKGQHKLIGTLGYWRIEKENSRAEIGYLLHKNLQGKGYMAEAIKSVISYGFETLKLHSIEANCNPLNIRSVNLLISQQFVQEAYFKENVLGKNGFEDTVILTRFKE